MKRLFFAAAFLSCVCAGLFAQSAQQQQQVQMNRNENRSDGPRKSNAPTTEQKLYGQKLLELAEGEAAGLQGGMRAYANLRLARAYQTTNPKKATQLLEDAFAATREIDDDDATLRTRSRLQVETLQAMVVVAPDRAEELLVQIDASHRADVLKALLGHYERNKQLDKAIDIIYRISSESEFPYGAAAQVMQKLPKEDSPELGQLFGTALSSYKQHSDRKNTGFSFPSQDLGLLVLDFWKQLPPDMVKEAIFEILKQNDPANNKDSKPQPMTVASGEGTTAFSSNYQYRLFELMPVLRQIDKDEAERLLKKNQEAADSLAKFPNGLMSVGSADNADTSGAQPAAGAQGGPGGSAPQSAQGDGAKSSPQGNHHTMMVSGGGAQSPEMAAQMAEISKMNKIADDAEAHPEQALANAATLQSKQVRADAFLEIAQLTWKKSPTTAKSALKQFAEFAPELDWREQGRMLARATGIYLHMGATEDAKRMVDKQLDAAARVLKLDNNADDPNKALRAYWPSTNAYAGALASAGQIDPAWALTILKDMPDAEVRFASEIALAQTWLHLPAGMTTTISATKHGVSMMMMDEE